MPAAVLSLATVASWSRFIRSGMIDVLNQDYIRTAYAKGRSRARRACSCTRCATR